MQHSSFSSRRDFFLKSAVLGVSAIPARPAVSVDNPKMVAANGSYPTKGMAAYAERQPLRPMNCQRRSLGPKDVAIRIHYCGVCHSDIHTAHGDWGKQPFPLVLGHEISGKVVAVGASVSRYLQTTALQWA